MEKDEACKLKQFTVEHFLEEKAEYFSSYDIRCKSLIAAAIHTFIATVEATGSLPEDCEMIEVAVKLCGTKPINLRFSVETGEQEDE